MNPKRQRKSPDRFGNNKEKNDDELLDEAERSSSVTVVDASIETEVISHSEDITILTPGELIIYKKLCLLETTCKRIDSRLRDVEVQVNTNTKTALNKLDTAGLVEFGLPVKNEDNFNDLEFKLLNSDFENKLFNVMKAVGGVNGKCNGEEVLYSLFDYIFDSNFLKTVSWTGKGHNNVRDKLALETKSNITSFITRLCTLSDGTYPQTQCVSDMKYKVIKYATRNANRKIAKESSKKKNVQKQSSAGTQMQETPSASSSVTGTVAPFGIDPHMQQPFLVPGPALGATAPNGFDTRVPRGYEQPQPNYYNNNHYQPNYYNNNQYHPHPQQYSQLPYSYPSHSQPNSQQTQPQPQGAPPSQEAHLPANDGFTLTTL